jgi:AraC-like DNA-binding protein
VSNSQINSISEMVKQYFPSSALSGCIDNYMFVDIDWSSAKHMASIWRLIPFGQVSILFLYGDLHGYSTEGADAVMEETYGAFMVGQLTKPIWLNFSGHTKLVKVQLKPSGAQQLLPMDLSELTDNPCIKLEDIWGNQSKYLTEQLHDANSDVGRVALLNDFFKKRLMPSNQQSAYIDYTLQQLHTSNGNCRLMELEYKLGITGRQLERVFKSRVGLRPKDIGRFIRMNAAFSVLASKPETSLTSLAYQLGYFDPAHFSKDFRQLTGLLPSKLKINNGNEFFVTHGQCFKAGI